jgi:Tetracyclin repressor-like, C-terminal domain
MLTGFDTVGDRIGSGSTDALQLGRATCSHQAAWAPLKVTLTYNATKAAIHILTESINAGELPADVDPELVVDAISGPLYYRLLMRQQPLTETYADDLVAQAFRC